MSHIQCHIVSAEEELFAGDVNFVIAAGVLGDLGISRNHAPLLTMLKPGPVTLQIENGEDIIFYVSGGFLEVQVGKVTILADSALRADDVDEAAALEAQKSAVNAIANKDSEVDFSQAAARLAEAAAQLRTIQNIRKLKK